VLDALVQLQPAAPDASLLDIGTLLDLFL
jgi:hypothetical protein